MANGVVYNGRGWCIAEKEWSAARSVLGQNMVMDGEADDESGDQETKKVPTAPDGFIRQMETSNFTHRNDQKDVVHLQEKIFYEKVTARKYLKLSDLTQAHLVELTGSLPHYQNLQVLKIELFTGEKEQVIAFVQALSTLPLQKLLLKNLRGPEGIGNVLAEALAAILTDHRSLTEVDLSYCEVSNVGAKALAKALQRNTTLTDLRFYGCEIDDFGVEALADAMQHNKTLTKLHFRDSPFGRVFTPDGKALERIWERIKANQEAAAEASGSRLGENTLLPVLSELLVACFISIFSFSLLLFLI
ncbi:LRR and CARD domains-containing protein 3) (Nucleotide-binding oligomerization domain protein 3) [Durusdinium trenchii]|uniref:LRR and CARD domains-containing protein 3 (Nucleotide-binding oligomerization domain protein 3 n=1 Tax=Durusdinium trenchii TaxID=1381693 RepID=A0ABP0KQA1_9DINO